MTLNDSPHFDPAVPEPETPPAGPAKGPRWISHLLDGAVLVTALVLAVLVRQYWLESTVITSGSMLPGMGVGDRYLVDHRTRLRGQWRRGDIVLFTAPDTWDMNGDILVKRIVGLPGETIEVQNGLAVINGAPLAEPYVRRAESREYWPPVVLGPDQYYVLGDNRRTSDDSRFNGPIPADAIRGRLVWCLWPPGRWGRLQPPDYSTTN